MYSTETALNHNGNSITNDLLDNKVQQGYISSYMVYPALLMQSNEKTAVHEY